MDKSERIEYYDGSRVWLLNGALHREDGPAVEWPDGHREWFLNGLLHRADGPAIEYPDGTGEWYLDGVRQPDQHVEKWLGAKP